tara:strand:+ start:550 stop:1095 length:546 start_codon:yes stop_codon:yes gene_type:complete
MIFNKTKLDGAYTIDLEKYEDDRGFFARSWDVKKFKENKLKSELVQCNISFSKKRGTLRGMHYQSTPYEEAKLVWCPKGSIYDVVIDLRPKSKTFKKWISFEINDKNYLMVYVPEGFAHGFITLEDNTVVHYQMSEAFRPEYSQGVLWNDSTFKIKWPIKPSIISKRDNSFLPFNIRDKNK